MTASLSTVTFKKENCISSLEVSIGLLYGLWTVLYHTLDSLDETPKLGTRDLLVNHRSNFFKKQR